MAMSLAYKFRKAERLLKQLASEDQNGFQQLCGQIQDAQATLLASAGQQMERCINRCEGICCRNIELDPIISHWDLVFILNCAPALRPRIRDCLLREHPLYTADCVFLDNGKGPCIFPENLRPEVCVVTFCQNDRSIRREIRRVKRTFCQLSWFVRWQTARAQLRSVARAVAAFRSRFDKTV
jgi:hypothetical protein